MLQPHLKFNDESKNGIKIISGALLASLLLLSACGGSSTTKTGDSTTSSGGDSSTSGNGGTSSGSGSASCTDIAGEPDIMGPISFTPGTVNSSNARETVMINIPVDADTEYVGVVLNSPDLSFNSSVGAITTGTDGIFTVPAPATQTLSIPVEVVSTAAASGNIYPQITLCTTDINTCKQVTGSAGVAVTYATTKQPSGFVLTRFKNFENGNPIIPTIDQIKNPTTACIATQALTVVP